MVDDLASWNNHLVPIFICLSPNQLQWKFIWIFTPLIRMPTGEGRKAPEIHLGYFTRVRAVWNLLIRLSEVCHAKDKKLQVSSLNKTEADVSSNGLSNRAPSATRWCYPSHVQVVVFRNNYFFFFKDKKALAFNRDRCCYLAFCLQLILFH
jgi:hypothetical protein